MSVSKGIQDDEIRQDASWLRCMKGWQQRPRWGLPALCDYFHNPLSQPRHKKSQILSRNDLEIRLTNRKIVAIDVLSGSARTPRTRYSPRKHLVLAEKTFRFLVKLETL
jgi:hypothetical protein